MARVRVMVKVMVMVREGKQTNDASLREQSRRNWSKQANDANSKRAEESERK